MMSAAFRARLLRPDWVVPPHNNDLRKTILILGRRSAPIAEVRVGR